MKAALLAAMAVVFASPALAKGACAPGLHSAVVAELFFGRNSDAGEVSEDDWRGFLDAEVTPRFPDGLTVWDGRGQWRGPDGVLERESSKVLLLALSGPVADQAKLEAIRSAYKAKFHQQSVLLVERVECVGF
jgi:hypothetical protein